MKAIKLILPSLILMLVTNVSMSQDKEPVFEMKTYYFVFLNRVPDRPVLDSVKSAEIQAGHLNHITQMFKDGKCKLAGPFMDNGETRGILILDVATELEAKELCSKDPAVINERLIPVIKPWYGPASLKVEPKKE